MFSTTLRISDELGGALKAAAEQESLSINAYLVRLLTEWQEAERRRVLAADWAAYAQDAPAQDVEYAAHAQAELAAETPVSYGQAKRRKAGRART